MRAARSRKIWALERASPSGAMAGRLSTTSVWPYDRCTSQCSSCVVAGRM